MKWAMEIFELTKRFPTEERYSMTDQVRRSSRSVCTNIAEAWRKRSYQAHFLSKLSDVQSEAEETRVWLEFALKCGYLSKVHFLEIDDAYDHIGAQLIKMIIRPHDWVFPHTPK